MIYSSDLGPICYIHDLRKRSGREFEEYIFAHCLLCVQINELFDLFLLDKSNMMNDVLENDDFDGLNSVSCWRVHTGLYIYICYKSLDNVVILYGYFRL
jgi:hypothetical protein